ncbi:MAG: type IV pilin protein [Plesiomonas sp.]|uniref:type IV pilin protein n=1 Tax=Plesiomonas sp. TaxID=2486279 RepID=UPI003F3E3C43
MKIKAGVRTGFTLIETMIVVAIIAIIAAIAIPSYQNHIIKSRRTEVLTQLLQGQLAQERLWLMNKTYSTNLANIGLINSTYYTFTTPISATANTYTLQATAIGSQTKDTSCTTLTLDDKGNKTPAACWR